MYIYILKYIYIYIYIYTHTHNYIVNRRNKCFIILKSVYVAFVLYCILFNKLQFLRLIAHFCSKY